MTDWVYEIAINPHDGYQRGLASMIYEFFDKKTGSRAMRKVWTNINEVLA